MRKGECIWYEEPISGDYWDTSCNERHCFIANGPSENKYEFCPYCGDAIKVIERQPGGGA